MQVFLVSLDFSSSPLYDPVPTSRCCTLTASTSTEVVDWSTDLEQVVSKGFPSRLAHLLRSSFAFMISSSADPADWIRRDLGTNILDRAPLTDEFVGSECSASSSELIRFLTDTMFE